MKDFKFNINGNDYAATVEEQEENMVQVTVNGNTYSVKIERENVPTPIARPAAVSTVTGSSANAEISAPLPGNITKILVSVGQKVNKGDVVMTMEAMKMENNITAESNGTVKTIFAQVGQTVNQGDVLVELTGITTVAPAPKAAPIAHKAAPTPKTAPTVHKAAAVSGKIVKAPLPGTITTIKVATGQTVKKGDVLLVMEAMKMANDIVSEWDGTVKNVFVQQGASVNVGDALVDIA